MSISRIEDKEKGMLQSWPQAERPREKLLQQGADTLSDAELLAIFLRTGVKGTNVVELARQLINEFGSIAAIYQADEHSFCQRNGLGQAKYVQLQATLEMAKRCLKEQAKTSDYLSSSVQTKHYVVTELGLEPYEVFGVLLLNNQHQVISFKRLFQGTLDAAAVYPRVVVEQVLKARAAAVILVHNHPTGVLEPSLADVAITEQLVKALRLIDVRVLDHLIVAGNRCYSFAEHGQI
ncbi:DNA repair protein RadC [Thalassotalea euphylliae]|uniref:RadC family protein n=1 Tax=Thalassotalea euphylliae TaxID=1655234 RepID=UPI0036396928